MKEIFLLVYTVFSLASLGSLGKLTGARNGYAKSGGVSVRTVTQTVHMHLSRRHVSVHRIVCYAGLDV